MCFKMPRRFPALFPCLNRSFFAGKNSRQSRCAHASPFISPRWEWGSRTCSNRRRINARKVLLSILSIIFRSPKGLFLILSLYKSLLGCGGYSTLVPFFPLHFWIPPFVQEWGTARMFRFISFNGPGNFFNFQAGYVFDSWTMDRLLVQFPTQDSIDIKNELLWSR